MAGRTRSTKPPLRFANDPPANPTTPPPSTGPGLRQLGRGGTPVSVLVTRRVGMYQPYAVTHKARLLMRDDPDVAFGLAIIRAPLINLHWSVESKDPEIAAFVEHVLRRQYRRLAMAGSLAVPFGVSVVAKVWGSEAVTTERTDPKTHEVISSSMPNAWVYKRFKSINPDTVRITTDAATDDWTTIEQQQDETLVRVGRREAAIWSFRREEVYGSISGYPILDQAYRPWYAKEAMDVYANRYFESKADPGRKARAHPEVNAGNGQVADGYEYMAEQLAAFKESGLLVLPSDRDAKGNYRFDVEYFQDDKRGDMFQLRIDKLGTQILRGLWITDRAGTTGETGARAEAEVHADVMSASLETMVAEWVDVLDEQVIPDLVTLNYGDERARDADTRIKSSGLSAEMKTILSDVLKGLLTAETMIAEGKKVKVTDLLDAQGIAEQLNIPIHSAEELEEMEEPEEEPLEESTPGAPGNVTPAEREAIAAKLKAEGNLE